MNADNWLISALMWAPLISLATIFGMIGGLFPLLRIFQRLGLNKLRVFWLYVPFLNMFFLWKLAFEHWPNVRSEATDA